MKVDIGPYSNDIIPINRLERKYEYWRSKDAFYLDESKWTWYDKLVFKAFDKLNDFFRPLNRWSNNRPRKVKVHIDNFDIWSLDHTLALVVLPALKLLREQKHGSPQVEPEDVPEHLRPTEPAGPENGYTDNTVHERWAWVMNEIIFAFEQAASNDEYGTRQFYHNVDQLEMKFEPVEIEGKKLNEIKFNEQKDPSKPAYYVDNDGKKAHMERVQNGFRLFGKYYMGLWD